MRLRDKTVLNKICSEIDVATEILGNTSLENFLTDETTKRAVAMTAINIGELVKSLTQELKEKNKNVAWKEAATLRNIAAHKYETLRMDQVYDTVKKDFPTLKSQIKKILDADEQ
jgi:uncharacterized protein with HEPN domain